MWDDLQPELDNGAFGGLLVRHFPTVFTFNSTYALFPFSTPHTTKANLEHLGIAHEYDLRRPTTPAQWQRVTSYDRIKHVLDDEQHFSSVYGPALDELTRKGEPSVLEYVRLVTDSPKGRASAADILDLSLFPAHWAQTAMVDVGDLTQRVLERETWSYGERKFRADLVGDVAVPVVVEYLADLFGVPLKTESNPLGLLTVEGLYDALTDLYAFVYLNFDPTVAFKLRDRARKHSEVLRGVLLARLGQTEFMPDLASDLIRDVKRALTGKGSGGYVLSERARDLYKRTLSSDRPIEELAGVLLSALVRLVQVVPQVANAADFFLDPSRQSELRELCRLSQQSVGPAHDSDIFSYVQEALRLQPAVTGVARRHKKDDDAGQLVWLDVAAAGRDDKAFSDPSKVDPKRDARLYKPLEKASSVVNTRGEAYNTPLVAAMIRELFAYNDPARAAGAEGQLGATAGPMGLRTYARDELRDRTAAFPGRMVVSFSGTGKDSGAGAKAGMTTGQGSAGAKAKAGRKA
ncbi:hypothetical protein DMC30DRAFT_434929 [Rhodotorula diobovata]|uniref:Cytochrome P450 n=1 Tax=Rhodotorula diobovata TaxID=5288 RepID=A0A5C5FZ31_9BASI|nr:hypothetical protein DMC30DRAFT_434929 [Rhodotorula diobovata]